MDPDIEFVYEGVPYTVSSRAYDTDLIILPDGRALEVYGWSETEPPSPIELHQVHHLYTGFTPADIADMMGGVVAQIK